jgi:xanthine/uracil permease
MEAIGDITASAEVSRVEVEGPEFDSRIQGGVLVSVTMGQVEVKKSIQLSVCYVPQSDGIGGFLSALFTVTPLSIFAQVCQGHIRTLPDADRLTKPPYHRTTVS